MHNAAPCADVAVVQTLTETAKQVKKARDATQAARKATASLRMKVEAEPLATAEELATAQATVAAAETAAAAAAGDATAAQAERELSLQQAAAASAAVMQVMDNVCVPALAAATVAVGSESVVDAAVTHLAALRADASVTAEDHQGIEAALQAGGSARAFAAALLADAQRLLPTQASALVANLPTTGAVRAECATRRAVAARLAAAAAGVKVVVEPAAEFVAQHGAKLAAATHATASVTALKQQLSTVEASIASDGQVAAKAKADEHAALAAQANLRRDIEASFAAADAQLRASVAAAAETRRAEEKQAASQAAAAEGERAALLSRARALAAQLNQLAQNAEAAGMAGIDKVPPVPDAPPVMVQPTPVTSADPLRSSAVPQTAIAPSDADGVADPPPDRLGDSDAQAGAANPQRLLLTPFVQHAGTTIGGAGTVSKSGSSRADARASGSGSGRRGARLGTNGRNEPASAAGDVQAQVGEPLAQRVVPEAKASSSSRIGRSSSRRD